MLRDAWDANAGEWVRWARAPGHDSYWKFHRDAFLPLVPAPGRLTLDVGCGEGRLSRDLTRLGHRVLSLDASLAMAHAAATHPDAEAGGGHSVAADASRLPLRDGVADCVVSFMALQDIDDMEGAIADAARVLEPGGHFVVAITHPLNTAGAFARFPAGAGIVERDRPFVIDGSWFERRRITDRAERDGYAMTFTMEHRPLHDYTEALADAGFVLERLREVTDPDRNDKWHRIPLFLHLRTRLAPSGSRPPEVEVRGSH
ncbi:MAG TPA: class I SAM-dependent methyltransferase [Acidimicrobiales bacterium]|nr:class I SAM-dependent methyltransferase [Acidimicrobiales bacterium]